jgi:Ca2+-binding EF-hand superfamily protein
MKEWQRKNFARAVKKKVSDIEACFKTFDMDGSGRISHAEFTQAMRRMGIRGVGDQESWQIMQKHRRPGNDTGEMLFEEFRDTMMEFLKVPTQGVDEEKPSVLVTSAMEALEKATGGNGDVLLKVFKELDPEVREGKASLQQSSSSPAGPNSALLTLQPDRFPYPRAFSSPGPVRGRLRPLPHGPRAHRRQALEGAVDGAGEGL